MTKNTLIVVLILLSLSLFLLVNVNSSFVYSEMEYLAMLPRYGEIDTDSLPEITRSSSLPDYGAWYRVPAEEFDHKALLYSNRELGANVTQIYVYFGLLDGIPYKMVFIEFTQWPPNHDALPVFFAEKSLEDLPLKNNLLPGFDIILFLCAVCTVFYIAKRKRLV